MTGRSDGRQSRWSLLVLAIVIAIGIALRFLNLGGWDLWTDEVQTLWMSESGEFRFGPMYRTAPINFWLTGLAVDWLGADEFGLRAVPAVTGSLTLVALYFSAKRWVSQRAAVLAVSLLAFSVWHLSWSQTGRHFALQTLFVLGGLHGYLMYTSERTRAGVVLMAGCLMAALFTHSSSGFYVAALLVAAATTAASRIWRATDLRTGFRSCWPNPVILLLVLLGVLAVYLPIYFGVGSYILETRSAWNPPWNILGSLGFYITPVLAAFAAGGTFYLWPRDKDVALTLVCLAVVPVVLLTVASGITIASAAYCLPSILSIVILAGAGCEGLIRTLSGRRSAFLVACCVVAGLFLSQAEDLAQYYLFQNGLKARWKEATNYVAEHRGEGERVWAAEGDVARYYLGWDAVQWLGEYPGDRAQAGDARGDWFVVYLTGLPDLGSMLKPTLKAEKFPQGARFEALYPVRYGPKDRSLVVLHRASSSAAAKMTNDWW